MKVELFLNKVVEPYNSSLLLHYALYDRRFHQLALIVKAWHKKHFLDPKTSLNSYSLILMLIAYLQEQKVLPCL